MGFMLTNISSSSIFSKFLSLKRDLQYSRVLLVSAGMYWFEPMNGHSSQKQPDKFDEILQTKARLGKRNVILNNTINLSVKHHLRFYQIVLSATKMHGFKCLFNMGFSAT